MSAVQEHVYSFPDQKVLAKYGFVEIDLEKKSHILKNTLSYQAEFDEGTCVADMYFSNGMIVVDEKLITDKPGDYTRIRLNRIWVDNDEELEVILRQTFPIGVYKPKR